MNYSEWIELAIERILAREPNSKAFELKELFTGDEWDTFSKGEKSRFGIEFAQKVRSGEIDGVRFAPIGRNGRHNRYEAF